MWERLRRWLNAIPIHDPIERPSAALLQIILAGMLVIIGLALLLNLIVVGPAALTLRGLAPNLAIILCVATAWAALRRGRFGWSVGIVIGAILLGQAQALITAGLRGNASALVIFVVPITLAGLLLGRRGLVLTIGLSVLMVWGVARLEQAEAPWVGAAPPPSGNTASSALVIVFILIVSLLGLMLDRYRITLQGALAAAVTREHELAARAVELSRANTELEQRTREITLLNELSDQLHTCLRAEEAYAVIAQSAQLLFPGQAGGLYVLDASRHWVEAVAAWGDPPPAGEVFGPDDCWALRRGQIQVYSGGRLGPLCRHLQDSPPIPTTAICIPMVAQSETLGMLHLQTRGDPAAAADANPGPPRLFETTQRLAGTLADSLALALANLKLRETLRSQSIYDELTGLFNRRYMEEMLARELHRAARNHLPLGVIMLDLDHFKRFNDTFGHAAGDALLRELGRGIRARIRAGDVACRYGGEEFTILLPNSNVEVARQRAEVLREAAYHLAPQVDGQTLATVTISLGVAAYPEHGATGEAVLRAADVALYRAKAAGRDQVVTA